MYVLEHCMRVPIMDGKNIFVKQRPIDSVSIVRGTLLDQIEVSPLHNEVEINLDVKITCTSYLIS